LTVVACCCHVFAATLLLLLHSDRSKAVVTTTCLSSAGAAVAAVAATSDSSEDANGLSKDQRQRKRKSEKIVKGVDLAVRIAKAIRPQASETTASAKKTEAARQVLLQREADLAVQQALHTKHATIRDNIAACGQDDPEWKAAMTAKLKAWTARLLDDDECDDVARIRGRSGRGGGSAGASGGRHRRGGVVDLAPRSDGEDSDDVDGGRESDE